MESLEKPESSPIPENLKEDSKASNPFTEIVVRQMQGMSLIIPVQIGEMTVPAVVDTAAEITILSSKVAGQLGLLSESAAKIRLRMADRNSHVEAYKVKDLDIEIGDTPFTLEVYVAPITDQLLLGFDFLKAHNAIIDLRNPSLKLDDVSVDAIIRQSQSGNPFAVSRVTVSRDLVIPPKTVQFVEVNMSDMSLPTGGDLLIEPLRNEETDVLVPYAVVNANKPSSISLLNSSEYQVKISKDSVIARLVAIDSVLDSDESSTIQNPGQSDHLDELESITSKIPPHLADLFQSSL